MSIYCPLAEALGIESTISILDIEDDFHDEYGNNLPPWNKGKKGLQEAWNKGLTKHNDERMNCISKKMIGRKPWNTGKNLSEDDKNKKSISRKKWCSNNIIIPWNKGTKGLVKGNPKTYSITTPDGDIITITNLKQFSINNGLSNVMMVRIADNGRKHKGYSCQRL